MAQAGAAGAAFSGATAVHQSVSACRRSVVVNLHNRSSCMLINPQVYTKSGYCYIPPEPRVEIGKTEACSFGNPWGRMRGSVGVMTYDIIERQAEKAVKRLAIMFSVPFDYTYYVNWMALGLFGIEQACDENLYSDMYYSSQEGSFRRGKACGSEFSFKSGKFTLTGTMSAVSNAECKVQFYDH